MPPYQAALCSRQKASSCAEQQAHLSRNVAWKPRAHVLALQSMQTAMRPPACRSRLPHSRCPLGCRACLRTPANLQGHANGQAIHAALRASSTPSPSCRLQTSSMADTSGRKRLTPAQHRQLLYLGCQSRLPRACNFDRTAEGRPQQASAHISRPISRSTLFKQMLHVQAVVGHAPCALQKQT